jgi:hypothetical protein
MQTGNEDENQSLIVGQKYDSNAKKYTDIETLKENQKHERNQLHQSFPSKLINSIHESENELDNIIEGVSFNMTHFNLFLLLMIFCTADGYTMISNSLIIPELEKQWDLSKSEKSLIGGSIFLGFMLGAGLSGLASCRGRQLAIQLGLTISTIGAFFSISSTTSFSIIFNNFIIGIGIGISLPCGMSIVAEVCNSKMRSYFLTYVWILFPIGEIAACLVSEHFKIFLPKTENWRKVYFFRLLAIMAIAPFTFLISESPRYLLIINKKEEAFVLLKELVGKEKEDMIDEHKKSVIIRQYDDYLRLHEASDAGSISGIIKSYCDMFAKKIIYISSLIFCLWYIVSFLFYGFLYVLPLILEYLELEKSSKKLNLANDNLMTEEKYSEVITSIIFSCLIEVPMTILCAFLPNMKCLGRVGSLKIGYLLVTIFAFLCYFFPEHITVFSCLYKASCSIPFNVILIYTSEIFPTHLKVTALGLSNFFCRFGGFTCPFIIEILFKYSPMLPFVALGLLGLIGLIVTYMLPYETLGMKNF